MYNFMDSTGYIATIYFPIVVVIGNFFILKLFLAVIMSVFSDLHRSYEEEERKDKEAEIERMIKVNEDKRKLMGGKVVSIMDTAAMII